jgi:hypothetical protein
MTARKVTANDVAVRLHEMFGGRKAVRRSLTTPTAASEGGAQPLPSGIDNPMTAQGDLIVGGTAGAPTRKAIGAEGFVLRSVGGLVVWTADEAGVHDHDAEYAALAHTHDDRYYTEAEVIALLLLKAEAGHTHDDHGARYLYHFGPDDSQPTWLTYEGTVLEYDG